MDPYRHHPELRGRITPPEESFFRTFTLDILEAQMKAHGLATGWWYSDAEREAIRAQSLAGRMDRDLWVFGYGSLMWNPAIHFAEVLHATIEDYARRFILVDKTGGRGRPECPGLFAGLDHGPGCEGLVFRIEADLVDRETEILFRRELLAPAYKTRFVPARTAAGTVVEAMILVADHAAEDVEPDLPRGKQVEYLATGAGVLGSSTDYLRGIVEQFRLLNIDDPETEALLAAVEAYTA